MKFSNPEARRLVKSAVAHRRLARIVRNRLSLEFRTAAQLKRTVNPNFIKIQTKHIDANLRCAAMDFATAREMENQ